MSDHDRHPAKAGDHARWNVTLYHNRCGKKIVQHYNGFTCEGSCPGGWHVNVMAHFNDDAMATRFHIKTEPDREEYAIVWKTDESGKKMYSTLVPVAEAHKYERFKL